MDTIEEYLDKVESAITTYLNGFYEYNKILSERDIPAFYYASNDDGKNKLEYEKWHKEHEKEIEADISLQNKYVAELFAMSTFSGAILQLAYLGINLFSNNKTIHPILNDIKNNSKYSRYCIGRIEHGLPIGLVILAGRNLYNHIDDQELRQPNIINFNTLSGKSFEKYTNSYYDLENKQPHNIVSNLMYLLGWFEFVDFQSDMLGMLKRS
jgi:hypothetical protein